jgi:DNA-binding transcriptional LysR family regulator
MNFRQLEIFRAVMLGQSASRAAELLGITQPAVSRALADLEAGLGFLVFERVRGRLRPTPEGQLFFHEVAVSFTGLDRLRMAAARIRDFGSGSLRLASLAAYGSTVVPRALHGFRRLHPGTAVTLQVVSSPLVRELVASGQFDLGIAADEVDLTGLAHRACPEEEAVCAMPSGHPLAALAEICPADLHEQPFIALAPEDRARKRLEQVLAAAGSRPQVVVETSASMTVCALALRGVGVGIVNPAAAEGFTERGLVLRPFRPAVAFRAVLLFRPDGQRSREVKSLTRLLLQEARRSARSVDSPPSSL